MLFSEPKIPQSSGSRCGCSACGSSFSALQRAENSSILTAPVVARLVRSFSALQRAENSSIFLRGTGYPEEVEVSVLFSEPKIPQYVFRANARMSAPWFQCSSASRKFLNDARRVGGLAGGGRFSALQRAENSSQNTGCSRYNENGGFSALQRAENSSRPLVPSRGVLMRRFSALQRAENSSPVDCLKQRIKRRLFQCSSASRKFLTRRRAADLA